jgi:hypothetical protein
MFERHHDDSRVRAVAASKRVATAAFFVGVTLFAVVW